MVSEPIDFGCGVRGRWTSWDPELDINPQYRHLADQLPVEKCGLILDHPDQREPVKRCSAGLLFELPVLRAAGAFSDRPGWTVESWEPLTLSPSIHCAEDKGGCGLHGFIRNGRWEPV